ncbi:hypothetical protein JKP88DRAFT_280721 [Tribonema minus]|uniref:Uncharacterized protein n=1 Tax=Tribonema minus TaxID=303371 RepID=A0A835YPE0_9STRA|nr:hypothetical protein JKP88DRAFT_280721 [Tribonema minus]
MEGYEDHVYETAVSLKDAKKRELWLFRVPKNVDLDSLEGLTIELPAAARTGAAVQCKSKELSMILADPAEHRGKRALFTSDKMLDDDETPALGVAQPFALQLSVVAAATLNAAHDDAGSDSDDVQDAVTFDTRQSSEGSDSDAQEAVTFDTRQSSEGQKELAALGWVEPYSGLPQAEGMRVRFLPAGARTAVATATDGGSAQPAAENGAKVHKKEKKTKKHASSSSSKSKHRDHASDDEGGRAGAAKDKGDGAKAKRRHSEGGHKAKKRREH